MCPFNEEMVAHVVWARNNLHIFHTVSTGNLFKKVQISYKISLLSPLFTASYKAMMWFLLELMFYDVKRRFTGRGQKKVTIWEGRAVILNLEEVVVPFVTSQLVVPVK